MKDIWGDAGVSSLTSEELQAVQLNILICIANFCDENNITYFLFGGTLLGAVRHSGFIPWDDDIDIAMPREQYDIFLSKWMLSGNKDLIIQNKSSDAEIHHSYSKVRLLRSEFVEKETENSDFNKGIFIDIFPIDDFPRHPGLLDRVFLITRKYLMALSLYKAGYTHMKNIWIKRIVQLTHRAFSLNFINELNSSIIKYYKELESTHCTSYTSGAGYDKHHVNKSIFEALTDMDFEGIKFTCPVDYDTYLRKVYGDYMELPKANERVSQHRVLKIDIEEKIRDQWLKRMTRLEYKPRNLS